MRKLVLLSLLAITTNTFADELQTFDQVKSAVTTGKSVRIAIDFSKCATDNKSFSQDKNNIGIFTPNEIIVDNNGRIVTSLMHFTLNNTNFPAKPVYQFVRYTLTSDNKVNLSYQVLDATNYAILTETVSVDCKVNMGAKIYV
ncbi:MAG: VirK family protein [Gammaproteobacteria bacterium]